MPSEEKFSLPELLGAEKYQLIQAINAEAQTQYFSGTSSMSYTEIGQKFLEAAEMTFLAMQDIRNPKARKFIIEEILLAMYDNAETAFARGWNDKPNLTARIRASFMVASLNLVNNSDNFATYTKNVDDMYKAGIALENPEYAQNEQEVDVAELFLKQATKQEINDQLALHVCTRIINKFNTDFYTNSPKPSAKIINVYRAAFDESLVRAANLNQSDFEDRITAHKKMQERYEQLIDKRATTNNISYAGKNDKSGLKKRKPKQ